MIAFNEVQLFLYGIDLNRESHYNVLNIKAFVIHSDGFLIPYPYELPFTLMNKVPETLEDVSKNIFYVWDSQAVKIIENESNKSSSKNRH